MGLLRNTWNSTHSQYPTWIQTEFRGLMPKIPRVSSQGIRKMLELFRFPHISTVFDVDFHVDFKRKKIPDVFGWAKSQVRKCASHEVKVTDRLRPKESSAPREASESLEKLWYEVHVSWEHV